MEPTAFTVTAAECDCGDCDGQHGHTRILDGSDDADGADESGGAETPEDLPPLEDIAAEMGVPVEVLETLDDDQLVEVVEALDADEADEPAADGVTENMGVLTRRETDAPDGGDGVLPAGFVTGARETDPDGGDGEQPRGFFSEDPHPDVAGDVPPGVVTGGEPEPDALVGNMGVLTRESDRE